MYILLLINIIFSDQSNIVNYDSYVTNPIAHFKSINVADFNATVIRLSGTDSTSSPLSYYISKLPPNGGRLHKTSQNYISFNTAPFFNAVQITELDLPLKITDPLFRIVYVPPLNQKYSGNDYFEYYVVNSANNQSKTAYVSLANSEGILSKFSFDSSVENWYIENNDGSGPSWMNVIYSSNLNRYLSGTDNIRLLDFQDGFNDKFKWQFVRDANDNLLNQQMATGAYDGTISFTLRILSGDSSNTKLFNLGEKIKQVLSSSNTHNTIPIITLECDDCNSNRGLRLIRPQDEYLNLVEIGSKENTFVFRLNNVNERWLKDPMNPTIDYSSATECEVAAVLNGLSRIKIFGDYLKGVETVVIDNVIFKKSSTSDSAFPSATCMTNACQCHQFIGDTIYSIKCCGYVAGA